MLVYVFLIDKSRLPIQVRRLLLLFPCETCLILFVSFDFMTGYTQSTSSRLNYWALYDNDNKLSYQSQLTLLFYIKD
jgi:hypothetical protein